MWWESNAWVVCERLIGWVTVLVLVFAVWNTLLRVEAEQARQANQFNATLEAIRERMGNDKWQKLKPIENQLLQSK